MLRTTESPAARVYDRNVPKADIPSVDELREIGRRLCARLGVRPHEPIDSVALRRVFDERAHKTECAGSCWRFARARTLSPTTSFLPWFTH